jgi:hypothetical protein
MKLIHDEALKALYQNLSRGLPGNADQRVGIDELLRLANGEHLGGRHQDALAGIAASADQALTLRMLIDNAAAARQLAAEVSALRRPGPLAALAHWWRSAALPPIFASAAVALMAVMGFQFLGSAPASLPQTVQQSVEQPLFGGAFEADDQMFAASLENSEAGDRMFNGDFDS